MTLTDATHFAAATAATTPRSSCTLYTCTAAWVHNPRMTHVLCLCVRVCVSVSLQKYPHNTFILVRTYTIHTHMNNKTNLKLPGTRRRKLTGNIYDYKYFCRALHAHSFHQCGVVGVRVVPVACVLPSGCCITRYSAVVIRVIFLYQYIKCNFTVIAHNT